jgi:hypothetical protein
MIAADGATDENEHFSSPSWPSQEYVHLQRQIHDALRKEHPEWVEPNGESPMCDSYEARLAEQLDTFTRRGSNARKGDFPSQ